MQDIHTLVMSTDHKDCRAEIITVDAQDSFSGSVFVLVTGAMHKNDGRRNFVQSFFLAPQDRGYYVLNDIFRYLDEDTQSSKMSSGPPVHELSNGVIDMYERLQVTSESGNIIKEKLLYSSCVFNYSPNGLDQLLKERIGVLTSARSHNWPMRQTVITNRCV